MLSAKYIADVIHINFAEMEEAGQLVSKRIGAKLAEKSTWQLSSRSPNNPNRIGEEKPMDEHIKLLVQLMGLKAKELDLLRASCTFDLWCFVAHERSNYGFDLSDSLIKEISKLQVNLIFDLYFTSTE